MTFDLTLGNEAFGSGKFANSLTAGYGQTASNPLPSGAFTIGAWGKTSDTSGNVRVLCGKGGSAWIGMTAAGKATAHYGNTVDTALNSTVSVNDGAWHYFELAVDAIGAGGKFFVDGVLVASSSATDSLLSSGQYGVGIFPGTGFVWSGSIDEVAVWDGVLHSSNFTPATAATSNTASGLLALWHLDGNGTDSAGLVIPATGVTMSGPSSGVVGVASSPITIGVTPVGSTITGTVTVTLADSPSGGTFSPANTVDLNDASPSGSVTFTPGSTGVKTISVTNNGGLTNPSNLSYTATASATVPGAPTIGTATAGNGQVSVGFSPPSSDGGSVVTGYTATLYKVSDDTVIGSNTGASSPISVTGPNGVAAYAKVSATNAVGTGPESAASNSVTPQIPNNALDASLLVLSPGNWNVISSASVKAINGGARFRTQFGGSACTLSFDMTGLQTPYPKVRYRVDRTGPWNEQYLAASIAVSMPSDTANYGIHLLEFEVRCTSEAVSRWSPQATAVHLTGISLNSGMTLTRPPELPLHILFMGDSITDGIGALYSNVDATLGSDATLSYPSAVGRALGAEVGIVGFGSQGWTVGGSGSVPVFGSTYNFIYSGAARSVGGLDAIVINHGTNDGSNNSVSAVTTVLNGLIAATNRTTRIIVLRPFNGNQAANLQAGIAACNAPTRVDYIDTTGFFNGGNSADGLHPYGNEHTEHIAPLITNAIRPFIAPLKGTRTARTITATLRDSGGAVRANLSALKWAVTASARPDQKGVVEDSGANLSTDANGVATFTVYTTAASGGTVGLEISDTDGSAATAHKAFSGPVVVN